MTDFEVVRQRERLLFSGLQIKRLALSGQSRHRNILYAIEVTTDIGWPGHKIDVANVLTATRATVAKGPGACGYNSAVRLTCAASAIKA
jgi:hypothetical protein